MRVLEARFHPQQRDGQEFVVVGHLVWQSRSASRRPTVTLSEAMGNPRRSALLSKLQYLIGANSPESFERLQALRSRFWSFVDVTKEPREA